MFVSVCWLSTVALWERVPVQSLFEYLEDNVPLDEFLDCFPTVRREDAIAVLEYSKSELLVPA